MKFRYTRRLIPIASLLAWVTLSGCLDRQPVAPDRSPQPRHVTWGAKRLIGSYQFGVECGVPSTLFPGAANLCGGTTAVYPLAIGSGDHIVTIRLSGKMHVDLSPNCNLGKSEWGPLGAPWAIYPPLYGNWYGIGYSWLTTLPYWHNTWSYNFMPPTSVNADSSVVEYSSVVDGEGEIIMERQQPVGARCNLTGSYDVQIFVQDLTQTPKLRLMCSPSGAITRGDSITCNATVEPQALQDSLRISGWSFDGQKRTDGDTASHTWAGPMVDSGTVHVRGTLLGAPVQDSVRLAVNPRNWPKVQAASPPGDSMGGDGLLDLPASPVTDTADAFGYTVGKMADSHIMRDSTNLPYAGRFGQVHTGPNAGWWYVTSPVSRPYWLVHHVHAFETSDPWFKKQHGGQPGKSGWLPYCPQYEITTLKRRALYHEGLLSSPISPSDLYQPAYTHYTFFRDWLSTHDLNKLFEKQTWNPTDNPFGFNSFAEKLELVWVQEVQDPETTANHALVDGSYAVPIVCRAR